MRTLKRILTILIVPLILIGGVNYCFDPDYTLRRDYIAPLVKALLNGKMISGPVNVNSRCLKKQWIKQLPGTPEILVLGSSRILALSRQSFPGKTFFNASVTNCTFQDMYAFLELFERKNHGLPPTIIVCADQWLFGNSFVEKQWLENKAEFMGMVRRTGGLPAYPTASKWELNKEWIKELFSVRYFIRSLDARGKTEKFEICQSPRKDQMMFLPDGSRSIPERVADAPQAEVTEKARNYFFASKDEYFTQLDSLQCKLFAGMIKHLKSRNCKIVVFIPPYHPVTFQLLKQSAQTTGVFKAESYLHDFAAKNSLTILGATNPDSLPLSASDFYDAVHLKPEAVNRFFSISRN